MFHEVATLVHPIESSKRAERAQGIRSVVLLEVPRPLEGRPYLVSAAINNLWRDKAFQSNKTAGDWAKRALLMPSAFCDQPWPGNDSGDDPGPSRTVGSGDTADAAHTMCLPDVLLCRFFFCDSRNYCLGILPRRQKFSKTRNKMLQLVNFP